MGSFPCLFKKAAYEAMNFCACGGLSIRCCCCCARSPNLAVAYLDVLDANTTHFVGIAGD